MNLAKVCESQSANLYNIKQQIMTELRCHSFAVVTKVDLKNKTIDAQPIVKEKIKIKSGGTKAINLPELKNVPYLILSNPPREGDYCVLLHLDRSIKTADLSKSYEENNEVESNLHRHNIDDAVALVGFGTYQDEGSEQFIQIQEVAPTEETIGNLGQFYLDITNVDIYNCTKIEEKKYTWTQLATYKEINNILDGIWKVGDSKKINGLEIKKDFYGRILVNDEDTILRTRRICTKTFSYNDIITEADLTEKIQIGDRLKFSVEHAETRHCPIFVECTLTGGQRYALSGGEPFVRHRVNIPADVIVSDTYASFTAPVLYVDIYENGHVEITIGTSKDISFYLNEDGSYRIEFPSHGGGICLVHYIYKIIE